MDFNKLIELGIVDGYGLMADKAIVMICSSDESLLLNRRLQQRLLEFVRSARSGIVDISEMNITDQGKNHLLDLDIVQKSLSLREKPLSLSELQQLLVLIEGEIVAILEDRKTEKGPEELMALLRNISDYTSRRHIEIMSGHHNF